MSTTSALQEAVAKLFMSASRVGLIDVNEKFDLDIPWYKYRNSSYSPKEKAIFGTKVQSPTKKIPTSPPPSNLDSTATITRVPMQPVDPNKKSESIEKVKKQKRKRKDIGSQTSSMDLVRMVREEVGSTVQVLIQQMNALPKAVKTPHKVLPEPYFFNPNNGPNGAIELLLEEYFEGELNPLEGLMTSDRENPSKDSILEEEKEEESTVLKSSSAEDHIIGSHQGNKNADRIVECEDAADMKVDEEMSSKTSDHEEAARREIQRKDDKRKKRLDARNRAVSTAVMEDMLSTLEDHIQKEKEEKEKNVVDILRILKNLKKGNNVPVIKKRVSFDLKSTMEKLHDAKEGRDQRPKSVQESKQGTTRDGSNKRSRSSSSEREKERKRRMRSDKESTRHVTPHDIREKNNEERKRKRREERFERERNKFEKEKSRSPSSLSSRDSAEEMSKNASGERKPQHISVDSKNFKVAKTVLKNYAAVNGEINAGTRNKEKDPTHPEKADASSQSSGEKVRKKFEEIDRQRVDRLRGVMDDIVKSQQVSKQNLPEPSAVQESSISKCQTNVEVSQKSTEENIPPLSRQGSSTVFSSQTASNKEPSIMEEVEVIDLSLSDDEEPVVPLQSKIVNAAVKKTQVKMISASEAEEIYNQKNIINFSKDKKQKKKMSLMERIKKCEQANRPKNWTDPFRSN